MKCFMLFGNLNLNHDNMDCSDENMEHFDYIGYCHEKSSSFHVFFTHTNKFLEMNNNYFLTNSNFDFLTGKYWGCFKNDNCLFEFKH